MHLRKFTFLFFSLVFILQNNSPEFALKDNLIDHQKIPNKKNRLEVGLKHNIACPEFSNLLFVWKTHNR